MIMTTTPSIEGKKIERYCGIVVGEAVMGANVGFWGFPPLKRHNPL